MDYTTNYSLKKPALADAALVTDLNDNANLIDVALWHEGLTVGKGAGAIATNTGLGISALAANTTGANNTACGANALAANTTGANNTACGANALAANTTGIQNTAMGKSALYTNSIGTSLTAVGYNALTSNTTGICNTAVGDGAGSSITTGSNVMCLGYNTQASAVNATNEISLGDGAIATLRCQVTTITAISDRRDKANIQDLPLGLAFLKTVRPVQFKWALRPEIRETLEDGSPGPVTGYGPQPEPGRKDIGFVSQDLDDAETAANANWLGLAFKSNPQRLESNSGKLFPVAVKAIQELSAMVEALQARVDALEGA